MLKGTSSDHNFTNKSSQKRHQIQEKLAPWNEDQATENLEEDFPLSRGNKFENTPQNQFKNRIKRQNVSSNEIDNQKQKSNAFKDFLQYCIDDIDLKNHSEKNDHDNDTILHEKFRTLPIDISLKPPKCITTLEKIHYEKRTTNNGFRCLSDVKQNKSRSANKFKDYQMNILINEPMKDSLSTCCGDSVKTKEYRSTSSTVDAGNYSEYGSQGFEDLSLNEEYLEDKNERNNTKKQKQLNVKVFPDHELLPSSLIVNHFNFLPSQLLSANQVQNINQVFNTLQLNTSPPLPSLPKNGSKTNTKIQMNQQKENASGIQQGVCTNLWSQKGFSRQVKENLLKAQKSTLDLEDREKEMVRLAQNHLKHSRYRLASQKNSQRIILKEIISSLNNNLPTKSSKDQNGQINKPTSEEGEIAKQERFNSSFNSTNKNKSDNSICKLVEYPIQVIKKSDNHLSLLQIMKKKRQLQINSNNFGASNYQKFYEFPLKVDDQQDSTTISSSQIKQNIDSKQSLSLSFNKNQSNLENHQIRFDGESSKEQKKKIKNDIFSQHKIKENILNSDQKFEEKLNPYIQLSKILKNPFNQPLELKY